MDNTVFWLLITLLCIFIQGLFSMMEMAALWFNRVRLQYYVSKGVKRAMWLQYLLQQPTRLFGTVMLGVNISLQIGSQSAREVYISLGLDPDFAALTQVFLVVILAELVPLFAANRYAEHVVMLGIPIVYAAARVLTPFVWFLSLLTKFASRIVGSKQDTFDLALSREELQKIVEIHDEEGEFNLVVANIFSLRTKTAGQEMTPLDVVDMIRSNTTVEQLRASMSDRMRAFVPIYHKNRTNIIGMAFARDLVRAPGNKMVRDFARSPWFITQGMVLTQILKQFRRNNQTVAVVLDTNGAAVGILTLDALFEEIFGESAPVPQGVLPPVIERSFPGDTKIEEFNREYGAGLDAQGASTLEELLVTLLGHHPENGESVVVGRFELIAEETTLLEVKSVIVKTIEM